MITNLISHGPVDKIKVKIIHTKVLERLFASRHYKVRSVESVPQLLKG